MPCRSIGIGIVCGPRERRTRCSTPNCGGWTEALCDFPVTRKGKRGTCDARMCPKCRTKRNENEDVCPPHAKVPWPATVSVDGDPEPGSARVHVETGVTLYVVSVGEHDGERLLTFARNPPDRRGRCAGVLQTVPLARWFEKTREP